MIRIYVDANILISAYEDETEANAQVWQVLREIERRAIMAITSQITLAEVLPKPLADGQEDLVLIYEQLLVADGFFSVLPVTSEILGAAARIRANRPSVKLPDAIHLASARYAACHAVFSADKRLASKFDPPVVAPQPNCLEQLRACAR